MKCVVCIQNEADLGPASEARWVGSDRAPYCSIHLIGKFGHKVKLVKVEDYVPPAKRKPPASKRKRKREEKVNG